MASMSRRPPPPRQQQQQQIRSRSRPQHHQQRTTSSPCFNPLEILRIAVYCGLGLVIFWLLSAITSLDDIFYYHHHYLEDYYNHNNGGSSLNATDGHGRSAVKVVDSVPSSSLSSSSSSSSLSTTTYCPVSSISQLSSDEITPSVSSRPDRYIVDPPPGGLLTLVCCSTTKGNFSALLHHNWAPLGVARLREMIQTKYFHNASSDDNHESSSLSTTTTNSNSSIVPLFRCTDACQFGLSSNPNITKSYGTYSKRLQDDPMWLPPGPDHRSNSLGTKRYPIGTWTYAGSGPNSRTNQFVITLKPNPFMGGGSPWEVPLGELVGVDSFTTISQWYTGYGEKGPSQKILRDVGVNDDIRQKYPNMDYITQCHIVDEQHQDQDAAE